MSKNFKQTKNFLKSPVYILATLILASVGVWSVKYIRGTLQFSYKLANSISLAILFLTIINVYLAMKDPDKDTNSLLIKCIPGIICFVAFILAKLYLRG